MNTSALSTTSPVLVISGNQIKATSLDVAEKFEKLHKNVLKDIRNLEIPDDFRGLNFELSQYSGKMPTGGTRQYDAYNMTRDGFTILAMGFTGKEAMAWKVKYLTAFNEMEQQLSQQPVALPSPDITPAQQNALQQIVARRADKNGSIRAYFWSRFNNHYKLGSYKQLPAAKFDEAVKYLRKIPAKATPVLQPPAWPQPENWLLPIKQQRLIEKHLNRVMGIFHPFSDQFIDLMSVVRLLRGRGPGGEENREMRQVLIQPDF